MNRIINCVPVGSTILVEHLSAQETYGTKLHIEGSVKVDIPQAIILAIGPNVEVDKYGFKVGDRVILQGTFVPVPNYGDGDKKRGLVEPHTIKGIIEVESV